MNRKPFLDVIAKAEGTSDEKAKANGFSSGYDVPLGYGKFGKPPKPLTSMTLAELDQYQTQILRSPSNRFNTGSGAPQPSSAAGRYQITRTTLRDAKAKLNLTDDMVFTPELQDRLANYLIDSRTDLPALEAGQNVDVGQIQNQAASIWASIPRTAGSSAYGQPVGAASAEVQAALRQSAQNVAEANVPPPTSAAADLVDPRTAEQIAEDEANLIDPPPFVPRPANSDDKGPTQILVTRGEEGCRNPYILDGQETFNQCNDEKKDVFNFIWQPTPNRFKQFSTMTYSVSLYVVTPQQYSRMLASGKKGVKGFTLFIQSGGISDETQDELLFGAKRSPRFNHDFYLDNIQFKSIVSGTGTGLSTNAYELNFNIVEPHGITFLDRLQRLVEDINLEHSISDSTLNYASQIYLMVVRFYGYDEKGNLISGADLESDEILSDPRAAAEKFIPFQFTGIQFRLTENLIEYQINAVCMQTLTPMDIVHGRLPHSVELQGKTLAEVLGGTIIAKRQDEQTEADFATKPVRGLMGVLNKHQDMLVATGRYTYKDQYEIEFEDETIGNAAVVIPGSTKWERSGHADRKDITVRWGSSFRDKKNNISYSGYRLFSAQAGMAITQLIDLIVRTSSFITEQADQTTDENLLEIEMHPTSEKNKDLIWFKVTAEVEALEFDPKRNDYAYKIKYIVGRYKAASVNSPYFPKNGKQCYGVHKKYEYWFTGQNTEVLSFHQDYNLLWFTSVGGHYDPMNLDYQSNLGTVRRTFYQLNSTESRQGATGRAAEGAASAASDLYSPADQAQVKFEIVGDPDFIGQSEIFYSMSNKIKNGTYSHPFEDDGSVNFNASEVYFLVNYNTVVDYSLSTGLADVTAENFGIDVASGRPGLTRHSFLYRANFITTQLEKGKFTQILEGTLIHYPKECASTYVDAALNEVENTRVTANSNASTAKLNGPVTDPERVSSTSMFPTDAPDILNSELQPEIEGGVIINNGKASDTPTPQLTENPNGNQSTIVEQDPNDPNANRVNGDDEGFLESVGRNVRESINTVGRVTREVWANRTPTNLDDLNNGG